MVSISIKKGNLVFFVTMVIKVHGYYLCKLLEFATQILSNTFRPSVGKSLFDFKVCLKVKQTAVLLIIIEMGRGFTTVGGHWRTKFSKVVLKKKYLNSNLKQNHFSGEFPEFYGVLGLECHFIKKWKKG